MGKAEIINNTIYLAGGYYKGFYPAFVEGYSLTDNKWTTGGKMYTGRAGPASGVVGGQFMIIGGEAAGDSVPQVESYDTAKGEWSIKKPSNIGRGYAGSVMLHDKIYLVGGLNGAGVLSANETLDLVSNLWETHRPMPLARTAISNSVTALKGKLFVIGGWSTTGATPNVEIYDPVTDTWAESTPLPMPLYHAAAATVGDTIYVFGGFTADGKASDVVLSYNMPPPPPPPPAPKKLTPAEIKKAAQLEKLAKQKATELMVATKKQQIIFNQQAAELKKTLSLLQKLGIEVPSSLTEAIQQIKDRLNRITAQAIK
ncbi:hypothetical protein HY224_00615 [Candidatus Uhrbacteria bacterium]|nr:hypothetical protein [Candidatus Uhrbacteria bacterium]